MVPVLIVRTLRTGRIVGKQEIKREHLGSISG